MRVPKSRASRLSLLPLEDRLTPAGNLYVTAGTAVREYTPAGSLVRTLPSVSTEEFRDVAVAPDGDLHGYTGTFTPTLRSLDSATSAWTARTFDGWSTVNNVSYGGVAVAAGSVFATDMTTYGSAAQQAKGIVRFDLATAAAERFATNVEPVDLNVGLDGVLYALDYYGTIYKFNPSTLAPLGSVTLSGGSVDSDRRAVAADAAGNLYVATWGRNVVKYAANGAFVSSLNVGSAPVSNSGLVDVDVAADGELVVGTWGGGVIRTTTALAGVAGSFSTGGGVAFVTYTGQTVPPPPPASSSVGDRVWRDANANGVQDAGEPGIAGVTVRLHGGGTVRTTTTDANGNYSFDTTGVANDVNYYLSLVVPAGFTLSPLDVGSDATDNDFYSSSAWTNYIIVGPGIVTTSVDAGLVPASPPPPPPPPSGSSVGDRVWRDANTNGIQDAGEPGIAGVTVRLHGGSAVLTTTTDANGNYSFNTAGIATNSYYYLSLVLPAGFTLSPANVGNDATDSDFYSSSAWTDYITVGPGIVNTSVDAGLVPSSPPPPSGSVGDRVWRDTNANGIQDSGEPGVAGVTVRLINNGTTIATTTTNASGNYSFSTAGLASASTYWVQITVPSGFTLSPLDVGSDATDNDFYGPGWTNYLTLGPNVTNLTVDAGLVPASPPPPAAGSVGDRVWRDTNGNGVQDSGEPGVAGVTVRLYGGGGVQGTTTDANGFYSFNTTNFPSGTNYYLQIVVPSGFTLSPYNQGPSDATDSDFYSSSAWTDYFAAGPGVVTTLWDAGLVPASPPPPATISVSSPSVNEGDLGRFAVTLSAPASSTVTVPYTLGGGTATAGTDYVSAGATGTISFSAGATLALIDVNTIGDAVAEGSETLFLTLGQPSGPATVANGTGTMTIVDVANPRPAASISDAAVLEGGPGQSPLMAFTVTLSVPFNAPLTLNYFTEGGSATSGVDFSAANSSVTFQPGETSRTITVPVTGDATLEPDETFSVFIANPPATNTPLVLLDNRGVGTILNDDSATPVASVSDAVPAPEGGFALFTISLSRPATTAVSVWYENLNGTAVGDYPSYGGDFHYTFGYMTFQPGETAKTVSVPLLADAEDGEPAETFSLRIRLPSGVTIGDAIGDGVVTDNPDAPLPSVAIADASVIEGNSGERQLRFRVTFSEPTPQQSHVFLDIAPGTATAGTDYTGSQYLFNVNPGTTEFWLEIPVLGELDAESDETVLVTIAHASGATISDGAAVGTIIDDDTPVLLSVADVSVAEGTGAASTVFVTFTRTGSTAYAASVAYSTQDGTATAGSDYQGSSGTVEFAAGETTKTVEIGLLPDFDIEDDETFLVLLGTAVGGSVGDGEGVVTLLNDD